MSTLRSTGWPWPIPAETMSSRHSPRTTGSRSQRGAGGLTCGLVRRASPGLGHCDARDREGQPRHAVRDLRRCGVDEQGQAARPDDDRPHRALLRPAADERLRPARRVQSGIRVPDQAVRGPVEQEGRRVLHAPFCRATDGQHPRPQGRRDGLRPGLRDRGHAHRGHRARQGRGRKSEAAVGEAIRPGEGSHHLRHRAHEPAASRHRGFQGRHGRHPAKPGVL